MQLLRLSPILMVIVVDSMVAQFRVDEKSPPRTIQVGVFLSQGSPHILIFKVKCAPDNLS